MNKDPNCRPLFVLTSWRGMFEKAGHAVPQNEKELITALNDPVVPLDPVCHAIEELTDWSPQELEANCPERKDKINKFMELYHVEFSRPTNGKTQSFLSMSNAAVNSHSYDGKTKHMPSSFGSSGKH